MITGCDDHVVLLLDALSTIKAWYKLKLLWLIRDMEMDAVLVFIAEGRRAEVDWDAMDGQEWFPYMYAEGKILVITAKPPMMRRNASGVKVAKTANRKLSRSIVSSSLVA